MSNETTTSVQFPPVAPASTSTAVELAASSAAAYARSQMEARYVMAATRPRDTDAARQALLRECARPTFADMAEWELKFGREAVTGPTIRLVETALGAWGNIFVDSVVSAETDDERIVRVTVTDVQRNTSYSRDVTVAKTVERKFLKEGQVARGTRRNSKGETVHIVEASDAELLGKEGALVSKTVRVLGLRLLPGWLIEDAVQACRKTMASGFSTDPERKRRELVDRFSAIGVSVKELSAFLGHAVDELSAEEFQALVRIGVAIRDGDTTWANVLREKRGDVEAAEPTAKTAAPTATAPISHELPEVRSERVGGKKAKVATTDHQVEEPKPPAKPANGASASTWEVVQGMADSVHVTWEEIAARIEKVSGARPESWNGLTAVQLTNTRRWLRVAKGAVDPEVPTS